MKTTIITIAAIAMSVFAANTAIAAENPYATTGDFGWNYSEGSTIQVKDGRATLKIENGNLPCSDSETCSVKVRFNNAGPFVLKAVPNNANHTLTLEATPKILKLFAQAQSISVNIVKN